MQKSKVILIIGNSGSGKGTVANYLRETYFSINYSFSLPLENILKEFSLSNSRENFALLSSTLRKNFGEDILGIGARNFIQKNQGKLIVLEGIRRKESLLLFKEYVNAIIWIETSIDFRYNRLLLRKEKSGENSLTFEEFLKQEENETEKSLNELKEMAHIVLENNSTYENLYTKIDLIFRET